MSRAIGWIRGRLSGRPDSEHGQAIVRLVIASVILAYLWILRELQGQPHTDALTLVMLAETLVAMSIMAGILWRPGVSHARRIFGMVTDYATLAVLMSLTPSRWPGCTSSSCGSPSATACATAPATCSWPRAWPAWPSAW